MNKVIVPPFFGEFGIMVMDHLRWVHQLRGYKIVCCPKGTEVLYPSAAEFFTAYNNPIEDRNRLNASYYWRQPHYVDAITSVFQRIVDRYPGVEILDPKYLDRDESMKIKVPIYAMPQLPGVDVVVCPRYREFAPEKNWKHWPMVVEQLTARGYTVGVAGEQATCIPVKAKTYAWQHRGGATEGTVDLLRWGRVYLGSDSGVSHLAALLDTPSIIFGFHDAKNPDQTHRMQQANRQHCQVLRDVWDDPQAVIDAVVEYLHRLSNRRMIRASSL